MHAEDQEIKRALYSAHPVLSDPNAGPLYIQMVRAVGMLPDGAEWMVPPTPVAVFARLDALFFIAAKHAVEERACLTSRRLDPEKLRVAIEWEEDRANEEGTAVIRATTWTFVHPDAANEPWREIRGAVTIDNLRAERHDRAETFARGLAAFAGWPNASD
jgi:hypothetical protein